MLAQDQAAPPATMISVENVRKVYGSGASTVEAISTASFQVMSGQFVSILGPSGCGKSTLLNAVAGLDHPTVGRITIRGQPVVSPRKDVGIVFQDAVLLPWKTVLENVLFPLRIMNLPVAAYEDRARELLDAVGLNAFYNKRPRELSGGMRQRVALCRALVHDPEVLLMDEPFSALDTITRDQMSLILMRLWERFPRTALFVTHSIREAVLLSDRVLVMGRRPSTIVSDQSIDFARPRDLAIGESPAFNEVCANLRGWIEAAHGYEDETLAGQA